MPSSTFSLVVRRVGVRRVAVRRVVVRRVAVVEKGKKARKRPACAPIYLFSSSQRKLSYLHPCTNRADNASHPVKSVGGGRGAQAGPGTGATSCLLLFVLKISPAKFMARPFAQLYNDKPRLEFTRVNFPYINLHSPDGSKSCHFRFLHTAFFQQPATRGPAS